MRTFCSILIMFCIIGHVVAQTVTIMSYNCENTFDTIHDAGYADTDYLPHGTHHWSRYRMYQKLRGICQVIMAADTLRPIDIVCLEEVENDTVLTYLTRRTALNAIGYDYIMTHSADRRGIDIALLYSPLTTRILHHHPIRAHTTTPTRDILYASLLVHGRDTLDIYAIHLPSQLNGREGSHNRSTVVSTLMTSVDSLRHIRPTAHIILLGDFNDGPRSKLIRRQLSTFINLADMKNHDIPHYTVRGNQQVRGTYKYQGAWDNIDQIHITPTLLPHLATTVDTPSPATILALPFLLEPDERYGGTKPRRTYTGYTYTGGISDHLPVLLRLQMH